MFDPISIAAGLGNLAPTFPSDSGEQVGAEGSVIHSWSIYAGGGCPKRGISRSWRDGFGCNSFVANRANLSDGCRLRGKQPAARKSNPETRKHSGANDEQRIHSSGATVPFPLGSIILASWCRSGMDTQLPPLRRSAAGPIRLPPLRELIRTIAPPPPKRAPKSHFITHSFKKRARRSYGEVERTYACKFPGCTKAYGALNHLNAHILTRGHGPRRIAKEFVRSS